MSLKHAFVAGVLAACVCVPQISEALCIQAPGDEGWTKLFATGGTFGFKITKAAQAKLPVGRLFRLGPAGQEEQIWERSLIDTATTVIISDDLRTVATTNRGCHTGNEHALVLYGFDGRLIADLAYDAIVPPKDWAGKVAVTSVGISWVEGTRFAFGRDPLTLDGKVVDQSHFLITFPGGAQVRIDRSTGRIVAGSSLEVKP